MPSVIQPLYEGIGRTSVQPPQAFTQSSLLLAGRRILLCESEALVIRYLKQIVQHLGMSVVAEVRTGEEAVLMALSERPEFVLIDRVLSDMDGIEVTRRILTVYPACVVLTTSYCNSEIRAEAYEAGVSGFVQKPFTADDLIQLLRDSFSQYLAFNPGS
jgi:DNA-binding NarL/FixJ family response regulator